MFAFWRLYLLIAAFAPPLIFAWRRTAQAPGLTSQQA